MAYVKPDLPAPHDSVEASPSHDDQGDPTRLPNGRFAHGHSGNRKGRPPNYKPSIAHDLNRILEGKTPSNSPAFAGLSLRDGLLLSMCLQGLKNYKAAQAVFNLLASTQGAMAGEASPGDAGTGEDALSHLIEREIRRRTLEGDASANDDDEDGSA